MGLLGERRARLWQLVLVLVLSVAVIDATVRGFGNARGQTRCLHKKNWNAVGEERVAFHVVPALIVWLGTTTGEFLAGEAASGTVLEVERTRSLCCHPMNAENRNQGTRGRGRRSRAKKWAVGFTALVAFLFLGEVAVRLFTDTVPPVLVRDAEIGRRFLKSVEVEAYNKEVDGLVPLRLNEYGFRGPSWSEEKAPGVRRVSILGDSMVASVSLIESETMAARLEARLQERDGGESWAVLNWGVPGSSTGQELTLFRSLVHRFQSDIVILGWYTGNDLSDNSRRLTSSPRIYYDFDDSGALQEYPVDATRTWLSQWLNLHSRLYVWQKLIRKREPGATYAKIKGRKLSVNDYVFCTDLDDDLAHAWEITRASIAALRDDVARSGGTLVVAMIPSAEQVYRDFFDELAESAAVDGLHFDQDYPETRLASICEGLDVRFHSLVPALREAVKGIPLADEKSWLFHQARGHWNARGNALGAESLVRYLDNAGG